MKRKKIARYIFQIVATVILIRNWMYEPPAFTSDPLRFGLLSLAVFALCVVTYELLVTLLCERERDYEVDDSALFEDR